MKSKQLQKYLQKKEIEFEVANLHNSKTQEIVYIKLTASKNEITRKYLRKYCNSINYSYTSNYDYLQVICNKEVGE